VPNTHESVFSVTTILLPIDFTPMSEAALEAATGLAQQFHARIHLVHIIRETPDFNGSDFFPETAVLQERRETIEEKLDARKAELTFKGVQTTFSIESGNDIVGTLMRVIKREKADMVVISTHGLSGWRPLILGSIAEHMIKQVDCALLLLKPGKHGTAIEEPALEVWEDAFVPNNEEIKQPGSNALRPETPGDKQLERSAEEMAARAGRTEQRYDQDHSLFTK
jgi:nucleotide-binding universal stress UspA family protein